MDLTALTNHMQAAMASTGSYPAMATTAQVEAACGVSAPAGESWRVVPYIADDGIGWLLFAETVTHRKITNGAGPDASAAQDWTPITAPGGGGGS